jgi:hypothetical protein
MLKREKGELLNQVADLTESLEDEKKLTRRLKRESSPRTSGSSSSSASSSNTEKRTSSSRKEFEAAARQHYLDEEQRSQARDRREGCHRVERKTTSGREQPEPLFAPHPAPNKDPNPFTPHRRERKTSSGREQPVPLFAPKNDPNPFAAQPFQAPPPVSYNVPPSPGAYAPTTLSFNPPTVFSAAPLAVPHRPYHKDGSYQLTPL